MKKTLFFLFFSLWAYPFYAQEKITSDATKFSLITCGKGKALYAQFGHTAIRVKDSAADYDIVFNYGMFNFETENFYLKFVKGITDYKLGVNDFYSFYLQYVARGIAMWEQTLNLTPDEKEQLLVALTENAKPENCEYRYNFIYDNCVTRPKLLLDKAIASTGDSIIYPKEIERYTFRELIEQYTGKNTWNKFGIDMVIGSSADKVVTFEERMFLPAEYMNVLQKAKRTDGTPLVSSFEQIYATPNLTPTAPFFSPLLVFNCLFVLIALLTFIAWKRKLFWLDAILFIAAGVLGLIIFYLMFFSFHPIVAANYNLLWLLPTHILFVLLLPVKKWRKYLGSYQLLSAVLTLVAISGYLFLPQQFNMAFLPVMLILFLRSLHFYAATRK
jgi:hypothetical protein